MEADSLGSERVRSKGNEESLRDLCKWEADSFRMKSEECLCAFVAERDRHGIKNFDEDRINGIIYPCFETTIFGNMFLAFYGNLSE